MSFDGKVEPAVTGAAVEGDSARLAAPFVRGDIRGAWRGATEMSWPHILGAAIAEQTRISGIAYPSVTARAAGFEGSNLVIFRDAVVAPVVVSILGRRDEVLERWP